MADGRQTLVPRGPQGVWKALVWSIQGLVAAFAPYDLVRKMRASVLVLGPLGLWLGDNPLERALLVGCLLLVLSAELLNSALEAIVDKVSPEFHEFAGRAKDMGSAAVFVLMVNVVLCWALVLWPRLS